MVIGPGDAAQGVEQPLLAGRDGRVGQAFVFEAHRVIDEPFCGCVHDSPVSVRYSWFQERYQGREET